jgi:hypothetical protein
MSTLEFTFAIDDATACIELTKESGLVYITGLRTTITPRDINRAQALCWINEVMKRISSAPESITRFQPTMAVGNDQTLAHIVAWTSKDLVTFKRHIFPLKFDIDKLAEFARKHAIQHIVQWLKPQEKTIVMACGKGIHNGQDAQYRITTNVKHINGVNTATFAINGMLTGEDLHSAAEAINIIRDIISNQGQIHSRIEKLRSSATFDEAAFVYIANLVKHPHLYSISATVRPGSVNSMLLETMTFE